MKALWTIGCALVLVGVSYAYQGPFREYPSVEYGVQPLPRDYQEKTEFAFAQLMYPAGWNDGYRGRFDGDWRQGLSLWTQDYPPPDRAFSQAVRRLTRIHTRSVEQCVNLDDKDEVYNWRRSRASRLLSDLHHTERRREYRTSFERIGKV